MFIRIAKKENLGAPGSPSVTQCQKPRGWLGRFVLWRMNVSHSGVTDWGLSHLEIEKHYTILDVGCGGGRTIGKLAALATAGKVYGVDFSQESVDASIRNNAELIRQGRVEVQHGSVSQLPFSDGAFHLVTAVETHFWWSDLPQGMREIFRVLKHGGRLAIVAEVYRGGNTVVSRAAEKYSLITGMKLLTADEHRELFADAGFSDIQIHATPEKGWICAIGVRST